MEKQNKAEYSLEEMFQQLEDVTKKMEGDLSLEEAFEMYHKGMDLLKICNDKIDKVEKQVLLLDEEGNLHEF